MEALKGVFSLISLFIVVFVYYLFQPALNYFIESGFLFINFIILLIFANICLFATTEKNEGRPFVFFILILILIIIISIVFSISESSLFNIQKNYTHETTEKNITDGIVEIDNLQTPIIDVTVVKNLAIGKISEKKDINSMIQLGNFDKMQSINGKFYYVIPLEFSGFFKWLKNSSEGTPGYLMVSATERSSVKYVQEVNGKSLHLRYMKNAYFSQNLRRHIRSSGLRTEGLTKYTFELDDDLMPYWVITIFKNTKGFSIPKATGVVICDPQSGKIKKYSIENAPDWVDIIQPKSLIKEHLEHLKHHRKYSNEIIFQQ